MLKTLKMVRGAVSEKNIVQSMTHFFIYQGRIQGTNGRVAIDAPIPELDGYSFTVPAEKFIKAIDGFTKEPKIEVADTRVVISEGKMKVRLPILANDAFPRTDPDPDEYAPENEILPALRRILPYISQDASKPWSTGAFITEDGFILATNNVIMVREEFDLLAGTGFSLNIPACAIEEMLSIGEEPTGFGIREDGGSITFYYEGGHWIRVLTLSNDWPHETITRLFNGIDIKEQVAIPKGFKEQVARLLPFCPNEKFKVVVLSDGGISTEEGEQSAEIGGFKLTPTRFNGEMLLLVLGEAKKWHLNPSGPSSFSSDCMRGVFVGVTA